MASAPGTEARMTIDVVDMRRGSATRAELTSMNLVQFVNRAGFKIRWVGIQRRESMVVTSAGGSS